VKVCYSLGYTHITNAIMYTSLGFLFIFLDTVILLPTETKFFSLVTVCNVHFAYIYKI